MAHLKQRRLYAFRRAYWYSWPKLIESMEQLAKYSFEWVLPGHGRRYYADSKTRQAQMQKCIVWMETQ